MEKQFNREERLMKKLLNDAGTEKPSADFKSRLMMKVEARNTAISPYTPLISKATWLVIGGIVFAAMLGLYILNTEQTLTFKFNFDYFDSLKIPSINLSRTMQIAIGFVALFFLEIPFLKRMIDRDYKF